VVAPNVDACFNHDVAACDVIVDAPSDGATLNIVFCMMLLLLSVKFRVL
jgi:hypothetical protein